MYAKCSCAISARNSQALQSYSLPVSLSQAKNRLFSASIHTSMSVTDAAQIRRAISAMRVSDREKVNVPIKTPVYTYQSAIRSPIACVRPLGMLLQPTYTYCEKGIALQRAGQSALSVLLIQ